MRGDQGWYQEAQVEGSRLVEDKAVMGDMGKGGGWFVVCTAEKIVEEGRKV